jgi:cell fate regulator YaaT (PSP1 superfamily)
MIRVVSIKFREAGKIYDFDATDFDLKKDDQVVVETERGRALGIVVLPPREVDHPEQGNDLKKVLRPVTEEDLELAVRFKAREEDAFRFCQSRIAERGMEMKLVQAEYLFDGSKIIFYFTAEGRVDFRDLVKDLAHYFHARIEMRQIGVRDEAKLVGGIGVCGRELCCCTFLRDFNPVSVKMAKEQGLALNPGKISGQCGRLLCCLGYEYETYCHLKRCLPKVGRIIKVGELEAMVLSQDIFAGKVKVKLETGAEAILTSADIEKGELPRPADKARIEDVVEKPRPADKPAGEDSAEVPKPARKKSRGRSRGRKKAAPQGEGAERKPEAQTPRAQSTEPRGDTPKSAPQNPQEAKPTGGERKRRPRRRSRKKDQ